MDLYERADGNSLIFHLHRESSDVPAMGNLDDGSF
jgi:hypothetical protein